MAWGTGGLPESLQPPTFVYLLLNIDEEALAFTFRHYAVPGSRFGLVNPICPLFPQPVWVLDCCVGTREYDDEVLGSVKLSVNSLHTVASEAIAYESERKPYASLTV